MKCLSHQGDAHTHTCLSDLLVFFELNANPPVFDSFFIARSRAVCVRTTHLSCASYLGDR